MIGLDTTAVIDFLREDTSIMAVISKNQANLALADISYAETIYEINRSGKWKHEERIMDDLYSSIVSYGLDKIVAKKASDIRWSLRKRGIDIGAFDCLLAATFLANGVTKILTRNVKHFEQIPKLKVITY